MPFFRIILNFQISERLKDYIRTTYASNILTMREGRNMTAFKVTAPSQTALDTAMADIRSRLVEIEELTET